MQFRMRLLDNAYSFLNESLRQSLRAASEPVAWKFAILDIVQSVELLLKERLHREHPLLVFENVDKQTRTVSLPQALQRLLSAGVMTLQDADVFAIEKAKKWRNLMMHYEFEFSLHQLKAVYTLLFEFVVSFHEDHLDGEVHPHINPDLWDQAGELEKFFEREFVLFNGHQVFRGYVKDFLDAQDVEEFTIKGNLVRRFRWGQEPDFESIPKYAQETCHDCGVIQGQYHLFGCDMERCPSCGGQMFGCECFLYVDDDESQETYWDRVWAEGKAASHLEEAQEVTEYQIGSESWSRVPFGEEAWVDSDEARPCPSCETEFGQLHVPYCDVEACQRCGQRRATCHCDPDAERMRDIEAEYKQLRIDFLKALAQQRPDDAERLLEEAEGVKEQLVQLQEYLAYG